MLNIIKKKELTEQEKSIEAFHKSAAAHDQAAEKWHREYLEWASRIREVDQAVEQLHAEREKLLNPMLANLETLKKLAVLDGAIEAAKPVRAKLVALARDAKTNRESAKRNAEHQRNRAKLIEQSIKEKSRGIIK